MTIFLGMEIDGVYVPKYCKKVNLNAYAQLSWSFFIKNRQDYQEIVDIRMKSSHFKTTGELYDGYMENPGLVG